MSGPAVGNVVEGSLRDDGRWLRLYCAAWAVTGLALIAMSAAPSMTVLLGYVFLSGLVAPPAAVTLRARLSEFDHPARLRLITVDQTVIRSAGTAGMLTLPWLVDAAPAAAFAGAFLIVAAAATVMADRRATITMWARTLPTAEPVPVTETAGSRS